MAQSIEGKTVKQLQDALSRIDTQVYTIAQGTTAYPPPVKARLAELVLAIAHMHAIDFEHGLYTDDDFRAMEQLALVHQYVTGNALTVPRPT